MIEKVTRALIVARFGHTGLFLFDPMPSDFPKADEAKRTFDRRVADARIEARAALEAMLEPNKAMIAVGQEALFEEQTVSYIWRAMITGAIEADDA